jgi:hypothetical protein
MLWNGNECGKEIVVRISRQPSQIPIMKDKRKHGECGIFIIIIIIIIFI